jgi:GlpG protein
VAELLQSREIPCEARIGDDHQAAIWVHEERDLKSARVMVDELVSAGDVRLAAEHATPAPRQAPSPAAGRVSTPPQPTHAARPTRRQARFAPTDAYVTFALIFGCLAVAFITQFGDDAAQVAHFTILARTFVDGEALVLSPLNQPWRIISPIFLHFGAVHLIFNVWWLLDLGKAVERQHGSLRYAALVFVSGALSNLAQLIFKQTADFGGASGVVYALFGYAWLRGLFDPRSTLRIPGSMAFFMLVWMAAGFSGAFDQTMRMANYCHAGGFVVGAAWGYASSRHWARFLAR